MAKKQRELGLHQRGEKGIWYFDYRYGNGQRSCGSTRCTSYREAVQVARNDYAEKTGLRPAVTTTRKERITLDAAFTRYFEERGHELADADDLLVRLDRIAERLGRYRFLDEITFADLHTYNMRRKRDGVANRTVNADVPESIRRVVKWAQKWGVDRGPMGESDFEWGALKLDLPRHRIRALTRQEKAALLWAVRKDYRRLVYFAMRSGLRLSAMIMRKDQLLWESRLIQYKAKSKYENDTKFLPMTNRIESLLRYCCAEDPDSEWVFTCVAQRTDKEKGRVRGKRYPINERGFERIMRNAVAKVGLPNWRLIHDLRHTAATDTMRASQHPGAVKEMLGHSTIEQTMKYAHVLQEDVRRAMEMVQTVTRVSQEFGPGRRIQAEKIQQTQ